MNGDRVHPLMSLYVSGDLTESERETAEAHLETCLRCREEVRALREMADLLAGDRLSDPGPNFWARFESSVLEGTRLLDRENSRSALGFLKSLVQPAHRVNPVRALVCASTVVLVAALGTLFVWKAHLRYSEPLTDVFSNLESPGEYLPVDTPYYDYLDDMSDAKLEDVTLAVTEWGGGCEVPRSADDLLESSTIQDTYCIFSEIEDMDSDELELLVEALDDWRESS